MTVRKPTNRLFANDSFEMVNFRFTGNLPIKKLTSLLLIFLFIGLPLYPTWAQTEQSMVEANVASSREEKHSESLAEVSEALNSPSEIPAESNTATLPVKPPDDLTEATETEAVTKDKKVKEEKVKTDQGDEAVTEADLAFGVMSAQSSQNEDPTVVKDTDPKNNPMRVEPDKFTGALVYNYPIFTPPGRNNFTPKLALKYNSQNTDNQNIAGFGWSLDIPYIQRENLTGVNNLYSTLNFSSSLSGSLTPTSATTSPVITFGAKVETGEFLVYNFNSSTQVWTVQDKQGKTYVFGGSSAERQDNPANSSQVFKWMLSSITDANGNAINFSYTKDNGQIYPSAISYTDFGGNAGIFKVQFNLSSSVRADSYVTYATGFRVKTHYRVAEIVVKTLNTAVRTYTLTYGVGNNGVRSLLTSITETGYNPNSGLTTTLPPTEFSYGAVVSPPTATWQLPVYLDNIYTRVADVNGDGRADILVAYKRNDVFTGEVYLNHGAGWSLDSTWVIPVSFVDEWAGGSRYIRSVTLVDINADGKDDIVSCNGGNQVPLTYLNTVSGWENTGNMWTAPCLQPNNNGGVSSALADLNGDGLVDYIEAFRSGETNISILRANMGVGWNGVSSLNTETAPLTLTDNSGYSRGVRVFDANYDGLADLVQYQLYDSNQNNPPRRDTYLHKGFGNWEADANFLANAPFSEYISSLVPFTRTSTNPVYDSSGDGLVDYHTPDASGMYGTDNFGNVFWNLGDINADGLLDYIATNCTSLAGCGLDNAYATYTSNVILHSNGKQDMLKTITNALGAVSEISYKPADQYKSGGEFVNTTSPLTLYTVEKIVSTDTFTGSFTESKYFYAGGKYFYNGPFDRQFGGFSRIDELDALNHKTSTYFLQADVSQNNFSTTTPQSAYNPTQGLIGKPSKVEIYDNQGNLLKQTINTWTRTNLGEKRDYVFLSQSVVRALEGQANSVDLAESFSYATTTGNLLSHVEWGQVLGNADGSFTDTGLDTFTTTYTYATSSVQANFWALTQETTTNQASTKVKESKYYYDTLAWGNLTQGNLTKTALWQSGDNYVDEEKVYNLFGLVVEEKDFRDKPTLYTYDAYSLYPTVITNPLLHTTLHTYAYELGKVLTTLDSNGNTWTNRFDGLGRIVEQKQPGSVNPASLETRSVFGYTDNRNQSSVKKTSYLSDGQTTESYLYYDAFKRPIQSRTQAEEGNYTVVDRVYNSLGLMAKVSAPYFATGYNRTQPQAGSWLLTEFTYDGLYRLSKTVNAVATTTTTTYLPWQTLNTDARGGLKVLSQDAYGNLQSVLEHNGQSVYATTYAYDYRKNLTQLTDANGNVRNFTYDGLGRRIGAEDLHQAGDTTFGTYVYTYDPAGNLTQKQDPKNQIITYTYDDLNRVLTEDNSAMAGVEVEYAYDTCPQGKGKLCSASSTAVSLLYAYDAGGNVVSATSTIQAQSFVSSTTFDRQGNKTGMVYPDGSRVGYTYNSAGLPETVVEQSSATSSVNSLVNNFNYAPTGQVSLIDYGNGTRSANSYDPHQLYRLTRKQTALPSVNLNATCASNPGFAQVNEAVAFTADASGGVKPYLYKWDTGAYQTSANFSKSFAQVGDPIITLSVKDSSLTPQVVNVNCAVKILPAPFSDNFTNANQSLATNWTLYNGGGMYELHNPGLIRLIGTTETSYMQIKSQREFFGKVDATFVVNDINQGFTQVALIDPTDSTPAVGVNLLGTSANVFTNVSPTNAVAGSYKNAWVTVRIIAGEGTASVYLNERLVKTLPFTPLNAYRLAVVSIGGGCCSLHYTEATLVSASEIPLVPDWVLPPLSGELVQDLTYTYDANGNLVNLTDTSNTHTAKGVDYGYDSLNRLIFASTTNASYLGNYLHTFTYDPIGNILNKSDVGNYVYNTGSFSNPHAVNSIAGEDYTYDNNGNLLSAGSKTYTWNYNNQLTAVIQPDATYTYTYDPFGQRLSVTNTSTTVTTLYPSKYYNVDTYNKTTKHIYVNDLLLASITHSPQITQNTTPSCTPPPSGDWTVASSCTFTGTANAKASVIVNPNVVLTLSPSSKLLIDLKHYKLLVKKNGGVLIKKTATLRQLLPKDTEPNINYIHSDHLSSANVITDSAGKVVQLLDYYPYGSKRIEEGSFNEQRRYTGHEYDADTGLSYMNARYYNGNTAKFVSQDPQFIYVGFDLADPQSFNAYAYARNNPLLYVDPTGESFASFLSWVEAKTGIGQRVDNSPVYNWAVENPWQAGPLVGIGSGVAIVLAEPAAAVAPTVGQYLTTKQALTGAGVNVAGQALQDLTSGKFSGVDNYIYSALTGAVGGGAKRGPLIQGGIAGIYNYVEQRFIERKEDIDWTSVGISAGSSAVASKVVGSKSLKGLSPIQQNISQSVLSGSIETPAQVIRVGVGLQMPSGYSASTPASISIKERK